MSDLGPGPRKSHLGRRLLEEPHRWQGCHSEEREQLQASARPERPGGGAGSNSQAAGPWGSSWGLWLPPAVSGALGGLWADEGPAPTLVLVASCCRMRSSGQTVLAWAGARCVVGGGRIRDMLRTWLMDFSA